MNNLLVGLLGLILAVPSSAFAGPDATMNRFLKDTPSMVDWGVERIRQLLTQSPEYGPDNGVRFDWDENRIVIFNSAVSASKIDDFEEECRSWFRWARTSGYVNSINGQPVLNDYSRYASMFGHSGFRRKIGEEDEETALRDLDKLIWLEFTRWTTDDDLEIGATLTCTGKLLSGGFSVSRE